MIPNGTYVAKLRGTAIIYFAGKDETTTDGRALMGFLPMTIAEGEHSGQNIDANVCFVAKDGSVMTRTIENMQEVFGMQGANPYWLQFVNPDDLKDTRERDLTGIQFNIVVEAEEYNNKTYARVKWINPLGSSGGGWTPKAADRGAVLQKFGSQFRALSGGSAVKPPAPPQMPKKPATPPPPTGPAATMEEAWEECCRANQMNESASTAAWQQQMAAMFPGKTNSDLSPQNWGALKSKFADNVPD